MSTRTIQTQNSVKRKTEVLLTTPAKAAVSMCKYLQLSYSFQRKNIVLWDRQKDPRPNK